MLEYAVKKTGVGLPVQILPTFYAEYATSSSLVVHRMVQNHYTDR